MPAVSEKQRLAACAELSRRREGKRGGKGRAFVNATIAQLRDFCRKVKKTT